MLRAFVLAAIVTATMACNRPSEDDCRQAVTNLQRLRGLENSSQAPDPEPAVRRCRSSGNPETVKCLISAKTAAEADRCAPKQKVN